MILGILKLNKYCCDIELPHWGERRTIYVMAQNQEQAERAFRYFVESEEEKHKKSQRYQLCAIARN